ncbi:MAG TPA: FAD-dependent oxidoreductase [Gammaproteobacteria bacterium]|nr:FAD-dependent oxidoreductase [Gammaproteobacteria bacterium]HBF07389.1 FAD-dependent oxidoreductase [Gammaproteobacteria bacterium]HCK91532.1 FAD-dependent oxidoreductase [Gammaproteobacteria bacterium]|tara:strand:- start:3182 stop:4504 length:1323 start_codon:yes stop_codon:yes gene_type:complete
MTNTQAKSNYRSTDPRPHVIIIGGGAGGLMLATRLAKQTKKNKACRVTLVDESLTHIWKPLLHEIAAGTLNSYEDEISYLVHGAHNNYTFQLGRMTGVDRTAKKVFLDAVKGKQGHELIPARELHYDYLVIATGSVGNDFGIPGVKENCAILDTRANAEQLHSRILGAYMASQEAENPNNISPLKISIIGGGATGVELASELCSSLPKLAKYGLKKQDLTINLIEAGPSLLPGQSETMIKVATDALKKMNINLYLNTMVTQVTENEVITKDKTIDSTITVWASGVKAPPVLSQMDGLETNRNNQIVAHRTLQSKTDDSIFTLGDSAEVIMPDGKRLTPRAQIAHQQALFLSNNLIRAINKETLQEFEFKDMGSFVSLGAKNSVGTVLSFTNFNMQGIVAKWSYIMLYRRHQYELLGGYKTWILIIKDLMTRVLGPKLKLH